jgi:DNA (cytosine-5)-methyltransferase 1
MNNKNYAYYNEIDPSAAAWLRELIKMKLIMEGEVDERSITEVESTDIREFQRVHFFAGIGGWELALQLAGFEGAVWTGSCPCQPFSTAGNQKGVADDRHLWPTMYRLIRECQPALILGEQVDGAIKHGWLDALCDDMEAEAYTVRSQVLAAACVGAPHIRKRVYWGACRPHDTEIWMADPMLGGQSRSGELGQPLHSAQISDWEINRAINVSNVSNNWINPEWRYFRDQKSRPIKSSIEPVVDGVSRSMVRGSDQSESINANESQEARTMRLKGYGNAIVPQLAAEFIISNFM